MQSDHEEMQNSHKETQHDNEKFQNDKLSVSLRVAFEELFFQGPLPR